jgi:hypothetical protein
VGREDTTTLVEVVVESLGVGVGIPYAIAEIVVPRGSLGGFPVEVEEASQHGASGVRVEGVGCREGEALPDTSVPAIAM